MTDSTEVTNTNLSSEKIERAKEKLTAEKARVEGLVEELKHEVGDQDEADSAGDLSDYAQHPADSGTDTFEREKDIAIIDGLEAELNELQAALDRIDQGTYGLDEQTGEPIDPARLEARPEARTNI